MRRSLLAALPLFATACSTNSPPIVAPIGDGRTEAVGDVDADDNDDDDRVDEGVGGGGGGPRLAVGSGARWRCVGPPSEDGQHTVLRLALQLGASLDDEAVATATLAPQFARHGLTELDPTTPPTSTRWTFSLVADVARTTAHLEGEGRVLTLKTAAHTGLATAVLSEDGVDVDLDCWDAAVLFSALPARYDEAVGHCVDEDGATARNLVPMAVIRETGFGECVDVDEAFNANDFGYPLFEGFNLRGAHLDGGGLFFANLIDADLRGTQLSQFPFGYAEIKGTIDDATAPPEFCTVDGDQLACSQ